MKPIYKWTGGKRKEIERIKNHFPEYIGNEEYKYVEPFFGGGALYWHLENNTNVINDTDTELINFLNTLKTNSDEISTVIDELSDQISIISFNEKEELISIPEAKTQRGLPYYEWRNKDRVGLEKFTNVERACRFYILNQFSFNGMRRFNSKGQFNVPYGNYKTFNKQWTDSHTELLNGSEILCGDYKDVMRNNDTEKTFIFIDPPYTREFNEYSYDNTFGNKEQIELADTFKSTKNSNIMIIINKDDFTSELYDGYIKEVYKLKYSTNIKNRFSNAVEHLLITNY